MRVDRGKAFAVIQVGSSKVFMVEVMGSTWILEKSGSGFIYHCNSAVTHDLA